MRHQLSLTLASSILAASLFGSASVAQPVLITAPQTIGPADTTITSTDGTVTAPLQSADITVRGAILTINGRHEIAGMTLEPGIDDSYGGITHEIGFKHDYSGNEQDIVCGVHLLVAGDFIVSQGAGIGLSGRGYGFREGPGVGVNNNCAGGGAGHGGGGGSGSGGCGGSAAGGTIYGSLYEPTDFGSGGTDDDNHNPRGGGAIRLDVGGLLDVSGNVIASATDGNAGRGAGGSILFSCGALSGNGIIEANGGTVQRAFNAGDGGGGGGGRIAIYYDSSSFSGTIRAVSGDGHQPGGAGSIVIQEADGPRTLIYDNHGLTCIPTVPVNGTLETDVLVIRGNARLSHDVRNVDGLTVEASEIVVEADGSIDATARGYGFREGPGHGFNSPCSGGGGGYGGGGGSGWGGCGSAAGGNPYGIMQYPSDLGSGGADDDNHSPYAGGRVTLNVSGQLSVHGSIRSDGTDGLSGRGSGGAVLIFAGSVGGTGFISANGGNDTITNPRRGGGGGGGRVAVYSCQEVADGVDLSAFGGDGNQAGTPGTVFIALNEADLNGDRVLDLRDIDYFIDAFINGYEPADLTRDGVHDLSDVSKFGTLFIGGCP